MNIKFTLFLSFSHSSTLHGSRCGEGVLRSLHGHKLAVPPTQQDGRQVCVPLHGGVPHAKWRDQKGELGIVQPHTALWVTGSWLYIFVSVQLCLTMFFNIILFSSHQTQQRMCSSNCWTRHRSKRAMRFRWNVRRTGTLNLSSSWIPLMWGLFKCPVLLQMGSPFIVAHSGSLFHSECFTNKWDRIVCSTQHLSQWLW